LKARDSGRVGSKPTEGSAALLMLRAIGKNYKTGSSKFVDIATLCLA